MPPQLEKFKREKALNAALGPLEARRAAAAAQEREVGRGRPATALGGFVWVAFAPGWAQQACIARMRTGGPLRCPQDEGAASGAGPSVSKGTAADVSAGTTPQPVAPGVGGSAAATGSTALVASQGNGGVGGGGGPLDEEDERRLWRWRVELAVLQVRGGARACAGWHDRARVRLQGEHCMASAGR